MSTSGFLAAQQGEPYVSVDRAVLTQIVEGFQPQEIGLARAWEEFYLACLAADADHALLRAIHDIKEAIEDCEIKQEKIALIERMEGAV